MAAAEGCLHTERRLVLGFDKNEAPASVFILELHRVENKANKSVAVEYLGSCVI